MGRLGIILSCFIFGGLFSSLALGANLGVLGATFPIKEPDLLAEIHEKLNQMKDNGGLAKLNEKMKQQAREAIENPKGITYLTETTEDRDIAFNPTIRLSQAVRDDKGNILMPAGTLFNPLSQIKWQESLVFIDGTSPKEVEWLKEYIVTHQAAHGLPLKIILTNGNWFKLSKTLGQRLYFDQGGALSQHFHLEHVPSVIYQEGLGLKIHEVGLVA